MALVSMTLVACGKPYPVTIDQAFEPYLETIQKEVSARGGPVYFTRISSVVFISQFPSQDLDGFCAWNTDKHGYTERVITISRVFWDSASDNQKIALLAHELGHCVLHREHDAEKIDFTREDGESVKVFQSVMYPRAAQVGTLLDAFASQDQDSLSDHYFDELLGL